MTLSREFYNLQSRIHPLNTFDGAYLKRDDELSFGISGTKLRKYHSLLPYLIANTKEVAIIGSSHSNNIVGLLQALIENQIRPYPFLLEPHNKIPQGNCALIQLLSDNITWVPRNKWPQVEQIAAEKHEYVIPEGANHPQAHAGSATLADDILRNEQEHNLQFDNIFIEAGSGTSAQALINRLTELKTRHRVHVVLCANPNLDLSEPHQKHTPAIATSFGSVNRTVLNWVKRIARNEGVLIDPLYGAKLFATYDQIHPSGTNLLIHSGGGLGLMGYTHKF
ncbi:MAG: pyridoxal-phosphate dependent enzyme [Simkaniaceae bacterium]|nr:pyridoxal-phosphate dependent enzyme [Simkaniaceae bacterium]